MTRLSANRACWVLGSGNIGTDLMIKLLASQALDIQGVVGIEASSDGLRLAEQRAVPNSAHGVDWLLDRAQSGDLVFDATSAAAHHGHVQRILDAGLRSIDLTPAKVGPGVVPGINVDAHREAPDVNLVSCGGQATIPLVAAVAAVVPVTYAEVVCAIASRSAGPGTRANIDEFTETTAQGLVEIGGARRGKAIIVLNPAEPPISMLNTVYCQFDAGDDEEIAASVTRAVEAASVYVPGYRLRGAPIFDDGRVTVFVDVTGAGHHLPPFAGNLDIMTSAAVRVAEELVRDAETLEGSTR